MKLLFFLFINTINIRLKFYCPRDLQDNVTNYFFYKQNSCNVNIFHKYFENYRYKIKAIQKCITNVKYLLKSNTSEILV